MCSARPLGPPQPRRSGSWEQSAATAVASTTVSTSHRDRRVKATGDPTSTQRPPRSPEQVLSSRHRDVGDQPDRGRRSVTAASTHQPPSLGRPQHGEAGAAGVVRRPPAGQRVTLRACPSPPARRVPEGRSPPRRRGRSGQLTEPLTALLVHHPGGEPVAVSSPLLGSQPGRRSSRRAGGTGPRQVSNASRVSQQGGGREPTAAHVEPDVGPQPGLDLDR